MRVSVVVNDLGLLFDSALILLATFDALVTWHYTVTFDLFLSARDTRHCLAVASFGRRPCGFGLLLLVLLLL